MHTTRHLLGPVLVLLLAIPAAAPAQEGAPTPLPQMFRTGSVCMGCHNGMVTPAGEDISMGTDWQASMMANAARDPYWHAAVRREATERAAEARPRPRLSRRRGPGAERDPLTTHGRSGKPVGPEGRRAREQTT